MPNRIDTPVTDRRDRGEAGGEAPLRVDIVMDTVCPWCYLGQQRFARAFAERPAVRAEIRWRAFQINRTAPAAGRDRASDLAARFGGPGGAKRHLAALQRTGEREGVAFRFDLIGRTPNTLDSHRLISFAAGFGLAEAMVVRLFRAYFVEGLDIGDRGTLAGLGAEIGLGCGGVRRYLEGDEDRPRLIAEDDRMRSLGVKGVPCYIIGERYAISGAQSPEVFLQVIDLARQDRLARATE